MNEELKQKETEVRETMETPAIPVNQKEPGGPRVHGDPCIPAIQSEPEEVPETMEIMPLQLRRANQRMSQRLWRPRPFQLFRATQRRSQRPWR